MLNSPLHLQLIDYETVLISLAQMKIIVDKASMTLSTID